MFKLKAPIFYFFLLLFLGNACKSDDTPEPPAQRTFADVEADFQALDLSPGTLDASLTMPNGLVYHFRIISPNRAAGELRPMVLTLHGASAGNPDAHKNTACYAEPGLEILDAFILSPNGGFDLWYDASNQQQIATLMSLALKYWPIDPAKIAVTGYSNGGNGSWFFGENQSSTLSAAIPMASSYSVYQPDSMVRKMDIPMYVIHGENDELFPLEETRGFVEATVAVGSDITFVVAPGLGHYTPCDYVPYLKEAAVWLEETVWMK